MNSFEDTSAFMTNLLDLNSLKEDLTLDEVKINCQVPKKNFILYILPTERHKDFLSKEGDYTSQKKKLKQNLVVKD